MSGNIKHYSFIWQLTRYGLAGLSSAVIILTLIYVFVEHLNLHYLLANNLAGACIYVYSFFVNKLFVFRNEKRSYGRQSSAFVFMRLALLIMANMILYCGVEVFGFHYMLMVIFISIVDAVIAFLIMKFMIFRSY